MTRGLRAVVATAALLLGAPVAAAEPEPSDLPPTTWPARGREACPSLRPCCVPGEPACTNPGLSRSLLGGLGGAMFVAGGTTFLVTGDSMDAGDPQAAVMGTGLVGLGGAALGALTDALTPGTPGLVSDRPMRPLARLTFSPGGSYVLGARVEPTLDLGHRLLLQPHVGFATDLGRATETVDVHDGLRARRLLLSAGTELTWRLPYPLPARRPLYAGPVELRYKPTWELRRRTLHPGEARAQMVEHNALYPATLGVRWHVSPRQRYTLYLGPRVDWIAFSDPGDPTLRRGGATLGRFYGEAWWQLDVPLSRPAARTAATGRLNLGYVHSSLDDQRFDTGAVIGYFGPLEVSVDLRLRRAPSPVGVQVTAGWTVATGGGPFVEIGLVPRSLEGGE